MPIRPIRDPELPLAQDIERAGGEAFREIDMPEIADDPPLAIADLARYLSLGTAWVAVDAVDRPIAYLIAEVVDGNLHIEQVTVHPEHSRRGVGRDLIDHAGRHAQAHGLLALTLCTFADVPWNAPYYARLGFRKLSAEELTPGLRELRRREAVHGLDRWPRVCMRRAL